MHVQFFCPRWGSENLSRDEFMQIVKATGYDGIEFGVAHTVSEKELDEIWNKAAQYKLMIIPQHYDTCEADFSKHCDSYLAWLEKMQNYKPVKINSQTGKDFFSFEQNKFLIDEAAKFTERSGVEVCHEIHRNKFSFAAHITKEYLTQIANLKITFDVSHWVCVAESFLEDQPEAIELAIKQTEHIHARVGYTEGPQIPDPRAPEWQFAVDKHLAWWDAIAQRKKSESQDAVLTITPEFGPYPYLIHLPVTQQPIAGQWKLNEYMMNMLKERYS